MVTLVGGSEQSRKLPTAMSGLEPGPGWCASMVYALFRGLRREAYNRCLLPSLPFWAPAMGSLWIGTGTGLGHWVNQNLINLNVQGQINSIVEDRNGAIWFIRTLTSRVGEICQVIGTATRCYGEADGMPLSDAFPLVQDASGNFWIGGSTGVVRWQPGSSSSYAVSTLKSNEGGGGVMALAANPDGSMLVGMGFRGRGLGLQQLVRGVWKPFERPGLDGTGLQVTALFMDREGALWIGAEDQGIYRVCGQSVEHLAVLTAYRATKWSNSMRIAKETCGRSQPRASTCSTTSALLHIRRARDSQSRRPLLPRGMAQFGQEDILML